jgi:DNA-binding beta-propeller fold protein YncE
VKPFISLVGLLLLAGCSGASHMTVVAEPAQNRAVQALPFESVGAAGRIYASDGDKGAIYVFSEDGSNQQPIGHFGSFSSPISIATDTVGNIYVPDWGQTSYDGRVFVMAPGKATPFLTLDDKGALPNDLAVDAAGTVYVANGYDQLGCGSAGDVRVYLKGATKSAYTICDSAIGQPYSQVNGVAVDTKGDVYVTWENGSYTGGLVREFTPGPQFVGHFLPPTFKWPSAVAIDSKNDVVVSDVSAPAVEVFSPGGKRLKYSFARTGDPLHVVFDQTEKYLFVADAIANRIDEYDYATGTLVNAIAFPGYQLDGVAVFPKAP